MSGPDSTRELFEALGQYTFSSFSPNPGRDGAQLERMAKALAAGADWNARLGPGGRDAAFTAATLVDARPLFLLFDHGVPLDHANGVDGMLIHRAASFSAVGVIEALVERGIAPDVRDASGRTPLAHAREWKHGKQAVTLLLGLMKKAGCLPRPAKRSDDLQVDNVRDALAKLGSSLEPHVHEELSRIVDAFFIESLGGTSKMFLGELAELENDAVLFAGIQLVRAASTAAPKAKSTKTKRLSLVHHGDLTVEGPCNAIVVVVTGNLTVKGLLTNFEGCVVSVGGDLEVEAAWSEGPLLVQGNVRAKIAFAGSYNDYATIVRGTLETPVLYQDGHHIEATLAVGQHYRSAEEVPEGERARLAKALGLRKL